MGCSPSLCLPLGVPPTPALWLWVVWSWIPGGLLVFCPPQVLTTYADLNWSCSEAAVSLFSEQTKKFDLLCLGRSSTMSSQVPDSQLMTVLLDLKVPHLGLDSHISNRMGNFFYPVWKLVVQTNLGVKAPPAVDGERWAPPGRKSGHTKVFFDEDIWRNDPEPLPRGHMAVQTLGVDGIVISGESNLFPMFSCMNQTQHK